MKLAKLYLPGLSGATLLFAAIILRIKGYRIVGLRSIDLPSNWIFLHPGLKEKVVDFDSVNCVFLPKKGN